MQISEIDKLVECQSAAELKLKCEIAGIKMTAQKLCCIFERAARSYVPQASQRFLEAVAELIDDDPSFKKSAGTKTFVRAVERAIQYHEIKFDIVCAEWHCCISQIYHAACRALFSSMKQKEEADKLS